MASSAGVAIILTGAPGAGKSTVAESLATRLERGAHIPVDVFRKMIKAGYVSPHRWSDEVALARNRTRSTWAVDEALLAELHHMLRGIYTQRWLAIGNSEGGPESAAIAIIRDLGLAG